MKEKRNLIFLCPFLLCVLAVTLIASVSLGAVSISPKTILAVLVHKMTGYIPASLTWSTAAERIIWDLRMPRTILGVLAGAGYALSGIMMQTLTKNPLANPYILGISSGASAGAVLVIVYGGVQALGIVTPSMGAFAGALAVSMLVFLLAGRRGRMNSTRLVLLGVSLSALCSSLTSFMIFTAPDQNKVTSALFWMTGSLSGSKFDTLVAPAIGLALSFIFIIVFSRAMNGLLLGDDVAQTLGVDTLKLKTTLLILSSVVTGFLVAATGIIGFIGLIIPHIARTFVGSDHRRVALVSVLMGPVLVVWADILARLVSRPEEVPIGVITALMGAPFFIWLIEKNSYGFGGSNG